MAVTKAQLRTRVRNKIRDWYLNEDAINMGSGMNTTTTTMTVDDGTKFNVGDLVDVEDECMKITAISTNDLTVVRAYKDTTAATHADDTVVYIIDTWSKSEINLAIEEAFRGLQPYLYEEYVGNFRGGTNRHTLDNCNTADYTEADDATAETLNTTDQKEGSGCLNLGLTHSAGYGSYSKTITSFDSTNYEYLCMWVYMGAKLDSTNNPYLSEDAIEVKVGNDASNYASIMVGRDELNENDWTLLVLNLQDFSDTGTYDKTATDYLEVKFYSEQTVAAGQLKMDEIFMTTYPVTTNKMKYRLPTDVYRVNKMRFYPDTDTTDYYEYTDYYQDGDNFVLNSQIYLKIKAGNLFDLVAESANYPVQLFGNKRYTVPTTDSTTINIQDEEAEIIVLYCAVELIENLFSERIRFNKYSSRTNRENSSLLDLTRTQRAYKQRYAELLSQHEKSPGASIWHWGDNY